MQNVLVTSKWPRARRWSKSATAIGLRCRLRPARRKCSSRVFARLSIPPLHCLVLMDSVICQRSHECFVLFRLEDSGATAENAAGRVRAMSRPLFDVPCVFEAREMLRKKVLGREVNVSIDYVLPKSEQSNMPERHCCTVLFGTTCAVITVYSYLLGEPKHTLKVSKRCFIMDRDK